jgi:hypothetical protein
MRFLSHGLLFLGLLFSAVVAALPLTGCGSAPAGGAHPVRPVTVTVTYDGSPVPGATITFLHEAAPAFGRTDAQGVARMKTYVEGDGAVLGTHRVTITKSETVGERPDVDQDSPEYDPSSAYVPATVRHMIPEHYALPTSGLTAVVTDGPNDIRFNLSD